MHRSIIAAAAIVLTVLPARAVTISLGGVQAADKLFPTGRDFFTNRPLGPMSFASGTTTSRAGAQVADFGGTSYVLGEPNGNSFDGCVDNSLSMFSHSTAASSPFAESAVTGRSEFRLHLIPGSRTADAHNNYNNAGCFYAVSYATETFVVPAGMRLKYLGFYWGSIDEYNSVAFFDAETGGNAVPVTGFGNAVGGRQLWSQTAAPQYGDAYVNFDFAANENVRRFEIGSTNRAFEFDNLAAIFEPLAAVRSVRAVDAPPSLALLAVGMGLLGVKARRRLGPTLR